MQQDTTVLTNGQREQAVRLTLDGLAQLTGLELEALFAASTASAQDLAAIAGHPRGRVLGLPGPDRGALSRWLRRFQGSSRYPWEGKSFESIGAAAGRGFNRARFPRRHKLFGFSTRLAASLVDGRPSVAIDYDVSENPRLVRGIYDELRDVGEGLYLGRGMMRSKAAQPRLVLWFAVDARSHDPAL